MRRTLIVAAVLAAGAALTAATLAERGGAEAAGADAAAEGIQVHGHWEIEVRDPDGTLARRVQFENDLMPSGGEILGRILARGQTVGRWRIALNGSDAFRGDEMQPCGRDGSKSPCLIVEPDDPHAEIEGVRSKNLVVEAGADAILLLSGSIEAASDGDVRWVTTIVGTCEPTTLAASCLDATQEQQFTQREFATPIPVAQGQQIAVRVAISFS